MTNKPEYEPAFPEPDELYPDEYGMVAVGGDLGVDILCEAYCKGVFPWTGEHPIPWYSPDPRMVVFPADIHISRSMQKMIRRKEFEIRIDTAFGDVMAACASMPREGQDGTWITPNMVESYSELHSLGIAHSIEAYADGDLCGGMYGLTFGRVFFGESMFHTRTNASKVVLITLCQHLQRAGFDMLDCQQDTKHLRSMGGVVISREEFMDRLQSSMKYPSLHYLGREPWSV